MGYQFKEEQIMIASKNTIKINNTIVFYCDEYNNGDIEAFDGTVQTINEKGVDVVYLSGYQSRNDFILWKDIIAKLDKRRTWIGLPCGYSGQFLEFTKEII